MKNENKRIVERVESQNKKQTVGFVFLMDFDETNQIK